MLEEKKKKLKEMFSFKAEGNNKKKIENLVVFVIILIITIIVINTIWNGDEKKSENTQNSDKVLAKTESIQEENSEETNELETKLENILQNIEGGGKVKVLLTYSESSTTVAMYNEDNSKSDTEETDTRSEEIEK